jgi:hypothetical protein
MRFPEYRQREWEVAQAANNMYGDGRNESHENEKNVRSM